MVESRFWRRVAAVFQCAPWLANVGRIIWRMHQPRFTAGAVGVMFNEDGQVLLVEHVFHPYHPWGLPGGWIDWNEHPHETLRREMLEELSLDVEVGPVILVRIDFRNHIDMAYLCSMNGEIGKLSSELLGYRWFDLDDVPRLHSFNYDAIRQAQATRTLVQQ